VANLRTFVLLAAALAAGKRPSSARPGRVVVAADDLYPQLPVGEVLGVEDEEIGVVYLRLRSGPRRHLVRCNPSRSGGGGGRR
jgi:hypothetical protein